MTRSAAPPPSVRLLESRSPPTLLIRSHRREIHATTCHARITAVAAAGGRCEGPAHAAGQAPGRGLAVRRPPGTRRMVQRRLGRVLRRLPPEEVLAGLHPALRLA